MHASLSSSTSEDAPKPESTSSSAITGQRVTLSAKQAAANSSVDPKAAEVVRVSLYPERVVMLRGAGDTAPGWNDVVAQDNRCRQP
ncbi:hypothetical protein JIQ42_00297 [Leishmania sp. Namibia]|uniref:hypothetical protein n=1 Tax=Leishmania sp. Namibia TaxID=2802991 RepID=UPI001B501500|nr:hypothetical protein JIQ42_00297 [Leishmania sp. Namibia]